MRIEGVIASAGMASQHVNPSDSQVQRERAQVAAVPNEAVQAAKQGDDSQAVGQQMLSSAVDQIEQILNNFNESMEFKVHKDTKTTIVTLVNKQTGEVIREFPSEKFLDLVAMFQKQVSGLHVDTNR